MPRLILVGGGHAHVEVLCELAQRPLDGPVTLITPHAQHVYSSLMPAIVRDPTREHEAVFALSSLAAAAGADLVIAEATGLIGGAHPRVHADGAWQDADVLSLDLGSDASGLELPGVMEHAERVRPYPAWTRLLARVDGFIRGAARDVDDDAAPDATHAAACEPHRTHSATIVGGGAGGFELALALAARCRAARARVSITMLDRGDRLFPGMPQRMVRHGARALRSAGIDVRLGCEVRAVTRQHVVLSTGERIASDLTLWLAGVAAPPLLARSVDMPLDARGYVQVDGSLRATDGGAVMGAGDCITMQPFPRLAKAGVYAVRQAPVLAHNLRALLAGNPLRAYRPQAAYLRILDTSDGRGLLEWRGVVAHAAWALRLKRGIDRRFMQRYRTGADTMATGTHTGWPLLWRGWAAGALAVLTVHQSLIAVAYAGGIVPWPAYSWQRVPPLGVPAVISAAFWGGVWSAILSPWWASMMRATPRGRQRDTPRGTQRSAGDFWWRAMLPGALLPTAVGAVLMMSGLAFAKPRDLAPAAIVALAANAAWATTAALLLRAALPGLRA